VEIKTDEGLRSALETMDGPSSRKRLLRNGSMEACVQTCIQMGRVRMVWRWDITEGDVVWREATVIFEANLSRAHLLELAMLQPQTPSHSLNRPDLSSRTTPHPSP
jgi:hypothetical protein